MHGEANPTTLSAELGRDIPATVRDLMTLRQLGLVRARRQGTKVFYRVVESRLPEPEPARADPRPVVAARCTCRHLVTRHRVNSRGMRSVCTACGDCRLFVAAKAVSGRG